MVTVDLTGPAHSGVGVSGVSWVSPETGGDTSG